MPSCRSATTIPSRRYLLRFAAGAAVVGALPGCQGVAPAEIARYRRATVISAIGQDFAIGQALPPVAMFAEQAPRIDIRGWGVDGTGAERVAACLRASAPGIAVRTVVDPPPGAFRLESGTDSAEIRQLAPPAENDAVVLLRTSVGGLPNGMGSGGRTWGLGMMDAFGIPARRFAVYANFTLLVFDGPGLERRNLWPSHWGTEALSQAELDEKKIGLRLEPRENMTPERIAIVREICRRLVLVGVDNAMRRLGFAVPPRATPGPGLQSTEI